MGRAQLATCAAEARHLHAGGGDLVIDLVEFLGRDGRQILTVDVAQFQMLPPQLPMGLDLRVDGLSRLIRNA